MLEVCEKYGWTYQQYYDQPEWFTELAIDKMRVEAQMRKNGEQ